MLYAPVQERITKKRPGHDKYAEHLNHALTSAPTSILRLTRKQDKLAHSTGVVYGAADATVTGSLSWRLAQIMDRRALHSCFHCSVIKFRACKKMIVSPLSLASVMGPGCFHEEGTTFGHE